MVLRALCAPPRQPGSGCDRGVTGCLAVFEGLEDGHGVLVLATLGDATGELLARGQRVGATRSEIRLDEVMALLGSTCQGALTGGWDHDLRRRTLDIVFAGLRTDSSSPST